MVERFLPVSLALLCSDPSLVRYGPMCRLPSLTWASTTPPAWSSRLDPDAVVVNFGGQR